MSAAEIVEAIRAIHNEGDVVEVRIFNAGPNGTISGYYNNFDKLAADCEKWDNAGYEGIYHTLNPLKPDLLARAYNRTQTRAKDTAKDEHVINQRWLPVDIDPERPRGISSTEEEHEAALQLCRKIREELSVCGWNDPIFADSGNGGHLLYLLPDDLPDKRTIIERILKYLDSIFSNDKLNVDISVHNPARIWKLSGTTARKGDNMPDRPHRKAKILERPTAVEPTPADVVLKYIDTIPKEDSKPQQTPSTSHKIGGNGGKFDVVAWMTAHNVQHKPPVNDGHGIRYNLDHCPFNSDHRDASITQMESGAIAFNCFHDTCAKKKWQDVRLMFEPSAYDFNPKKAYTRSDWGNARRLVDNYGNIIRYCIQAKRWAVWDGTVWKMDDGDLRIQQCAKKTIQAMYEELSRIEDPERKKEFFAYIIRCEQQAKLKCMVDSASNEPGIPIDITRFDTYKDLINVSNGILNLRTSELYPHDPDKYFTKKISYPYNKDAQCPRWLQFLNDVFEGDLTIIDFIQRFFGYSLTGHTKEQVFLIFYGHGNNGKGTFVDTIQAVMEEYYGTTDPSTIIQKKYERSSTNDLAELKGKRLVTTSENDPHQILDEGRIKRITGQDPLKCRFLYQEFFEYVPEYELILLTNHEPIIRGQDYSIWRRVLKLPFDVIFEGSKIDNDLRTKLAEEKEGIFRWLVEGAKNWYESGLHIPEKVKTATAEYKETLDITGEFLSDCCDINKNNETMFRDLYLTYTIWCKINYHEPAKSRVFGRMIAEKNFQRNKTTKGIRRVVGLNIKKELLENIRLLEGIEDEKTLYTSLVASFRPFLESKNNSIYTREVYINHSDNDVHNEIDATQSIIDDVHNEIDATQSKHEEQHIEKYISKNLFNQSNHNPKNGDKNGGLDQTTIAKYLNSIREEWYFSKHPDNPHDVLLNFMTELTRRLLNDNFTPPNSERTMKYVNDAFCSWGWV